MLLRSSSTPVLNSCIPRSKDSSPEPEMVHQIRRTPSITLSASPSSLSGMGDSANLMTRALSETDLRHLSVKGFSAHSASFALLSFSELDEKCEVGVMDEKSVSVLVGAGIGGGGGRICRRGASGGGGGDGWDQNHGNDSTDEHYQIMIEANPGNPLFLSNYARYLKEVRADNVKAEEYCSRAILANPNDGNILSMYADMIWESHKDASRAESYFDQAVKASPDDCYVLASYAHFLWDAEEEDDAVEENSSEKSPSFFIGAPAPPPPLAAVS